MAFEFIACNLTQNMQGREEPNINRCLVREIDDPFELPSSQFRKLYGVGPDTVLGLVERLEGNLKGQRITSIPPEKQVLCTLRFYASGHFQRPVGKQWGISMSQSSISRCVHRVTDAINSRILFEEIKFPMTQMERQAAKEIFSSAPAPFVEGTIGVIDCTHVAILAPKVQEEAYVNHHSYHSINVQMICDPNLKILNVNAKFPGAQHDSYIWRSSAVRRIIERAYANGNRNMFLIGDSGYPLEPWLMTPLPNQPEGTAKYRYNEAHCKARNPVERLFGVLKGNWRCLSRVLMYEPGFAGKVVNACSALHNISLSDQPPEVEEQPTETQTTETHLAETGNSDNLSSVSSVARRIQDRLIANYFA